MLTPHARQPADTKRGVGVGGSIAVRDGGERHAFALGVLTDGVRLRIAPRLAAGVVDEPPRLWQWAHVLTDHILPHRDGALPVAGRRVGIRHPVIARGVCGHSDGRHVAQQLERLLRLRPARARPERGGEDGGGGGAPSVGVVGQQPRVSGGV